MTRHRADRLYFVHYLEIDLSEGFHALGLPRLLHPHVDEMLITPRVLIADADDALRTAYRQGLTSFDIEESGDGRDALVKMLKRPPALFVTELQLPIIDGFALCDILRRDRTTAQVPILVVTSVDVPRRLELARGLADAVLMKPIATAILCERAAHLIAHSEQLRQRGATASAVAADQLTTSALLIARSREIRSQKSTLTSVPTRTPPLAPPTPVCSKCHAPLVYLRSYVGGVSDRNRDQWDYFECAQCGGLFQYRQRSRKLRRLP